MRFDFSPQGMMTIKHLRFRRLWVGVGVLLVTLVTVGSIVSVPQPVKGVMMHDKILHTVVYACLMGWFAQIYRHDLTRLILVVGLVALGVFMEFLQGMVPSRQFDVLDMVANTSGVVLAWALAYTWVGNVLPWVEEVFCRKVMGA